MGSIFLQAYVRLFPSDDFEIKRRAPELHYTPFTECLAHTSSTVFKKLDNALRRRQLERTESDEVLTLLVVLHFLLMCGVTADTVNTILAGEPDYFEGSAHQEFARMNHHLLDTLTYHFFNLASRTGWTFPLQPPSGN